MKALIITLCSLFLVVGMIITPSHAGPASSGEMMFALAMGGTVEKVDPAGASITIRNDMGQKEYLLVMDVSELAGLAPGDRVRCEVYADGRVTKIIKAPPLPKESPAPEPKG
ncbi:MAG TPA: hypothetical protein VGQ07_08495 [Nitrospirales bacterium]|jgi:Cu/Ag efflux protein CusF|nr:hypothetical protein [Nitrospirales bacterium]